LTCDSNSLEVYKGAPPEMIQLPLTSLWMKGLTGECYFTAEYLGDKKNSTIFKISKKLVLSLSTSSFFSNPGETITIKGNVNKLNGLPINGEVSVNIPEISESKIYGPIINGGFSVDYIIPFDVSQGDYRIDILAFEKSGEEKTSEGMEMADLTIFQQAKDIDIAIDKPRIDPGESLNIKPILLDQSGKKIETEISLIIKDPDSNSIFEKLSAIDETIEFKTESDFMAGYYNIEVTDGKLSKTKDFYINEKALVKFEIRNNTVIITNIGNIPYNKSVQIDVSGKTFIRKLDNLMPGETKEFYLTGENDNYDVLIKDDSTELSQGNIPLTGKAISVSDTSKSFTALANTPIIVILIIILLGAAILFLFRDILKKKSVAYPKQVKNNFNNKNRVINLSDDARIKANKQEKEKIRTYVPESKSDVGDKSLTPLFKYDSKTNPRYDSKRDFSTPARNVQITNLQSNPTPLEKKEVQNGPFPPVVLIKGEQKKNITSVAEQGLVMNGHKNKASLIVIKLKEGISKFARENLEKSLEHAYSKKAAVYENGNYVFIIFSPLVTRTFKNDMEAIKTAEKIVISLNEFNRKFSDKIIYGIGINSGEIINKIENKKLKFTSLGNLTVTGKKLADNAGSGQILLSKEVYQSTMAEVKAEKKLIAGIEVYELKKVADYDKNKKFISDFIKRERNTIDNNNDKKNLMQQKPSYSNNNSKSPLSGLINDSIKNKPIIPNNNGNNSGNINNKPNTTNNIENKPKDPFEF
jgi:hypothetical protein